ncbi:MAG TPA: TlpA family protein disulfide reductase [Polyangiaceae bacterium]|nr:TlpA family protein disulfide reductase [Polyangiaceae bacterium]
MPRGENLGRFSPAPPRASRRKTLTLALAAALAAALAPGCGGGRSPAARAPGADAADGPAERSFRYESLDENEVSSAALRGRATLLVFAATYGDASLLQTRFAQKVHAEHAPRINAAAIFLEPIENRPLVRVFCNSIGLRFPAAMADADAIQGKGAFTGLNVVPSTVVLDARGREVWRKVGIAPPDELHAALRRAQADDL